MAEAVISLTELAERPRPADEVGGKAVNLARLRAAGIRVPDGFVVPVGAGVPAAHIRRATDALGGRLAVRSSSPLEDRADRAAPGVFGSRVDVAPDDVAATIDEVRASGRSPTARAYAAARGEDGTVSLAVVVQRYVPPGVRGVVYTRAPGDPDSGTAIVEIDTGTDVLVAEVARADGRVVHADDRIPFDEARLESVVADAIAAEEAIGATRGADVELVHRDETTWIVQARPIVHGVRFRRRPPPLLFSFSRGDRETAWRMDVDHNPDPLSPAQAGIVERVDRAGLVPFRQRVVGGYLYYARSRSQHSGDPAPMLPAPELRRRFEAGLAPRMEEALSVLERPDPPPVAGALSAYERFYREYGAVAELVRAPRDALVARLRTVDPDRDAEAWAGRLLAGTAPASLESWLARAAAGEASFDELLAVVGPMAPAWDVAVPTYGERPELLRAALGRAPAPTPDAAPAELDDETDRRLRAAREARDIGERDDQLFARAQWGVRRALLALAGRWELSDPQDIFFLPLDEVVSADTPPDPEQLHRRANAARSARERQRAWAMPLEFADGRPLGRRRAQRGELWTGRGTGGRAGGIVARADDLGQLPAIGPDTVLVAAAVTPAASVALRDAAALVTAHGGLLGHGAAMARELGVPCIVDCPGAWDALRDGDRVLVDADAGFVLRRDPV